jgi:hypothetical protein
MLNIQFAMPKSFTIRWQSSEVLITTNLFNVFLKLQEQLRTTLLGYFWSDEWQPVSGSETDVMPSTMQSPPQP